MPKFNSFDSKFKPAEAPRVSFIVPAYNEALEIADTLRTLHASAQASGASYDIIVVDDASTDGTAQLALEQHSRIVSVQFRKISAVRNAGAKVAKGEWLFFVDADTRLPRRTLLAALMSLQNGACGGGAWVKFEGKVPMGIRMLLPFFNLIYMKILGWAAGCFVFAKRDAFWAAGGFDESLYATEEIFLSQAMKRQGRFEIVGESVFTSARKIRMYSPWVIFPLLGRFALKGMAVFQNRHGLDWWYSGKREK